MRLGTTIVLGLACSLLSCVSERGPEPLARSRAALWTGLPAMSEARSGAVGAPLPGKRALIVGGSSATGCLASAEIFDGNTRTWSSAGSSSVGRGEHTVTALGDGRALIVGGYAKCSFGGAQSVVEVFDPSKNVWTRKAPTNSPRAGHSATLLSDGTVLVAGGPTLAGAEVYDPIADAWTPVGAMAKTRYWHGAVRLADGRVLVAGGTDGGSALSSAELYDPTTRTWKATGELSVARAEPGMALLRDGRVIIAGGNDGTKPSSTSELWDPASGTWKKGPSLRVAHDDCSATSLPNGQVLVFGGEGTGAVEMLDAAGTSFLDFGFAIAPRTLFFTARLDDGSVLIGGGETGGIGVDSAELYTALADGAPCKRNEECSSFVCDSSSKTCTPPPDAGLPPADATPVVSAGTTRACRTGAECSTGFCVDGVCCDRACTERCHSCALPSSPGKCTPEPTGVDLRGECGAALSCAGTCGPGGDCIGASAGTQCARSKCTGPSTGFGPTYCTAQGAPCKLEDAVPFECAPYGCEPAFGACRATCASSLDCAGGAVCDVAQRVCTPAQSITPPVDDGGCTTAPGAPASPFAVVVLSLVAALRERLNRSRERPGRRRPRTRSRRLRRRRTCRPTRSPDRACSTGGRTRRRCGPVGSSPADRS